jgi:DNA-binding MarR family transcriptional regulator
MQNKSIELTCDVKRSPEVLGRMLFFTIFIAFEMAPKRVQLSLSEKNVIAALHKAGLKGAAITREMGYPLSTVYCVLKRIRQHGTVER